MVLKVHCSSRKITETSDILSWEQAKIITQCPMNNWIRNRGRQKWGKLYFRDTQSGLIPEVMDINGLHGTKPKNQMRL